MAARVVVFERHWGKVFYDCHSSRSGLILGIVLSCLNDRPVSFIHVPISITAHLDGLSALF